MRVRRRIDEKEINNGTKRRKETNFLNKKVDAKRKSIQTADGLLCGVARAKEWHGYISAKKGASLLISLRQRHSFFLILYFFIFLVCLFPRVFPYILLLSLIFFSSIHIKSGLVVLWARRLYTQRHRRQLLLHILSWNCMWEKDKKNTQEK